MSNVLNLLSEKAIENMNEQFIFCDWADSSDVERVIRKAIEDYSKATDSDFQYLLWDYSNQMNDIVTDYLKSNFKTVRNSKNVYYYVDKHDFKSVEDLEKFFNI